jgi:hypothetical protein
VAESLLWLVRRKINLPKKNMRNLKYIAVIAIACASFMGLASKASAVTMTTNLTIGDSHELGFVEFGIPSGDADRTTYVNHLITMALGTSEKADGQNYTRSLNFFGALPSAVFDHNGTSTTIDLGASGFTYLFAKYDGPNYGSEVWYVGNLTGTITIPSSAGGYGLSGWTLFTPGVPTTPDSGSTIAFLGVALAAVELVRRAVSRRAVKA